MTDKPCTPEDREAIIRAAKARRRHLLALAAALDALHVQLASMFMNFPLLAESAATLRQLAGQNE
jgi:hypothetical protein